MKVSLVFVVHCAGRDVCDVPIPRPEETYPVCLSLCVIQRSVTLYTSNGLGRRSWTKQNLHRVL